MHATYIHSTGIQKVEILGHNGEDLTHVRFVDSGKVTWVSDSDLSTCQIVCPGHHFMVGAGENLISGIEWCPNIERADDEDWDALCAD